MSLTKDRKVAILFMLLSVFIIINTFSIKVPTNISEPGGRLFPQIAGVGMFICSIGMFFTKSKEDKSEFLTKDGWKRLGSFYIALIVYFLGLVYLGFLVATPICLFAFVYILKSGKKVNPVLIATFSIIFTLIIYFAFTKGFAISLPKGILFR